MGNKPEATWHPGDGPVKPTDLPALIARCKAGAQDIEYDGYAQLLREVAKALAAETARADQAEQRIADAKAHVATLVSALAKENDVRLYILAKRAEKVLSAAPTTGQEAK